MLPTDTPPTIQRLRNIARQSSPQSNASLEPPYPESDTQRDCPYRQAKDEDDDVGSRRELCLVRQPEKLDHLSLLVHLTAFTAPTPNLFAVVAIRAAPFPLWLWRPFFNAIDPCVGYPIRLPIRLDVYLPCSVPTFSAILTVDDVAVFDVLGATMLAVDGHWRLIQLLAHRLALDVIEVAHSLLRHLHRYLQRMTSSHQFQRMRVDAGRVSHPLSDFHGGVCVISGSQ